MVYNHVAYAPGSDLARGVGRLDGARRLCPAAPPDGLRREAREEQRRRGEQRRGADERGVDPDRVRGEAEQQRADHVARVAPQPRTWDAASWLSDAVPHLAYGAVTWAALAR